jgi:hypothetical protein
MRGKTLKKIIMFWQGHHIDEKGDIRDGDEGWHPFGGLRWIGIYPMDKLYAYEFEWVTLNNQGVPEFHDKRWLTYLLLKEDVYFYKVENAEDKNGLPLNFEMVITLKPTNPGKSLFNVENWLEAVINRVQAEQIRAIKKYSYEQMIGKEKVEEDGKEIKDFDFDEAFKKSLADIFSYFDESYGQGVVDLQTKKVDPGEGYRKATTTKYEKEKEAEGINVLADAETGRIDKVYSKIEKFGEIGKLIRTLEAAEKSPIVGTTIMVPGLTQLAGNIFPGNAKEMAQKVADMDEEIRMLKGKKDKKKKETA